MPADATTVAWLLPSDEILGSPPRRIACNNVVVLRLAITLLIPGKTPRHNNAAELLRWLTIALHSSVP